MINVRVSVITIVRNDVENIISTMLSVLNQTYSDFEYVIKDGLSTDGTQKVIQETVSIFKNTTVKYISSSDSGIYDAMNQAVSYSSGEWVIFINSGDLFCKKNVLSEIFDSDMLYQGIGILYGDAIVRDESGDAIWKANLAKMERKMPFCHQSCFIRKELLVQHPFSTKYRIASDYNNILDLYQLNEIFYDLDMVISIFQLDGISSTDFVGRFKERNAVLSAHGLNHKFNIVFLLGLFFNQLKSFFGRHVSPIMLVKLKKWYKKNIKKYELLNDKEKREYL